MANYTKGEWKVGSDSWDTYIGVGNQYLAKMINSGSLTDAEVIANAHLISAAPLMYETLRDLPRPKSILEEAAYTGGDVPKKWINDRGQYIEGYNQAIKDFQLRIAKALVKAEGR